MLRRPRPEVATIPLPYLHAATKHAWATSDRDGLIFETLIETAIRNQECRHLLIGDVWKKGDVVLSLILRPEIAKNGRKRVIPLSGPYREKLRSFLHARYAGSIEVAYDRPLFPSRNGGRVLTRRGLVRIVSEHLKAIGSEGTPHSIRHTAATELLRVSNARVVQKILGHARLDTVMIYTHPSDDDLRQAIEAARARKNDNPKLAGG